MEQKELTKIFIKTYSKSNNIEEALISLKNSGATQMESLKILKAQLSLTISQADAIILNSETWSHNKGNTLNFRSKFFDYLKTQCK